LRRYNQVKITINSTEREVGVAGWDCNKLGLANKQSLVKLLPVSIVENIAMLNGKTSMVYKTTEMFGGMLFEGQMLTVGDIVNDLLKEDEDGIPRFEVSWYYSSDKRLIARYYQNDKYPNGKIVILDCFGYLAEDEPDPSLSEIAQAI